VPDNMLSEGASGEAGAGGESEAASEEASQV
jgi:hypothetical protein